MVIQKLLIEEGIKRGLKESQKYSVSVLGYDFIGLVSRLAVFYVVAFIINAYFIASIKGGIWLNSLAVLLGSKPFPDTLPQWLIDLFTVGLGTKGLPIRTDINDKPATVDPYDPTIYHEYPGISTQKEPTGFNPPGWDKPYDYGSIEHHKAEPGKIPALYSGFTITFWQIIQIISILIVVVEAMQYDRMLKEKGQKPNITTLAVFSLIGIGISLMTFPQMIQKIKERRIVTNAS
jgi:hypothetical protein